MHARMQMHLFVCALVCSFVCSSACLYVCSIVCSFVCLFVERLNGSEVESGFEFETDLNLNGFESES